MTETKETGQVGQALALSQVPPTQDQMLEKAATLLTTGDISKMTSVQKGAFLTELAKAMGLQPFPPPFNIITTKDGRQLIYANKSCADQLRKIHRINIEVLYSGLLDLGNGKVDEGSYVVRVRATLPDGRCDEEIGSAFLPPAGEERSNAMMKAITKAKRRVTYAICGLAFLDELEVETIKTQGPTGPRQYLPPPSSTSATTSTATTQTASPIEATIVVPAEGLPPQAIK